MTEPRTPEQIADEILAEYGANWVADCRDEARDFVVDQLKAYAAQQVAQERERCAQLLEDQCPLDAGEVARVAAQIRQGGR